jgi:hypothetical protein
MVRPAIPVTRCLLLVLLCATAPIVLLCTVGVRTAVAAPWATNFSGQCCYGQAMESGQRSRQFFRMVNAGTEVWLPGHINVAELPRDSAGPFSDSSWHASGRPATVTSVAVLPGQSETFHFIVQAPTVSVSTAYTSWFALVAEQITWMDGASGLGVDMRLPWTVEPAVAPSAQISSAPTSVTQGDPIVLRGHAIDNVDVDHVVATLDGGSPRRSGPTPPDEPNPKYKTRWDTEATFDSTRLSPGTHTLTITAVDGIGLQTAAQTTFTVNQRPAPAVTTGSSSVLSDGTATVNGTVVPNGAPTTAHFDYGPTAAYGSRTPDVKLEPGAAATPVTATLTGLVAGATYHYRLVASSFGGQTTGSDLTFSTAAAPVAVVPPVISTRLAPTHDFRVAVVKKRDRIVALIVSGTSRAAVVRVTCVRRCGKRGRVVARRTSHGTNVPLSLRGADRLSLRSRFTVTVRQKGRLSRFRTYQAQTRLPYTRVVSKGCRDARGKSVGC